MRSTPLRCLAAAAFLVLAPLHAGVPVISTPPHGETVMVGASVTLTVVATGSPAPTFQWTREGRVVAGATEATLSFPNAQHAQSGDYTVVVTNTDGRVISALATLTVVEPLTAVYSFATLAGIASAGTADGTGTNARFRDPWGCAFDPFGNLYISDSGTGSIRKVSSGNVVSTLGGVGAAIVTGGPALAADASGYVYVADLGTSTFLRVAPGGGLTTIAGRAGFRGTSDGTGSAAAFYFVTGLVLDGAGNAYVCDQFAHTIRKVVLATGTVTTISGQAFVSGSTNGTGTAALFNGPVGLAYVSGTLLVSDGGNRTIRKLTLATGVVTTFVGSSSLVGTINGTGATASFGSLGGISVDAAGNAYVLEPNHYVVRKITPAGVVTTLAGLSGERGGVNGTGSAARFDSLQSLAADSAGNVYVTETSRNGIRKITPAGVVTTPLGIIGQGDVDGIGSAARFYSPYGVATDAAGTVYVGDSSNARIRKVTPAGSVSSYAGYYRVEGLDVDATGTVYFAGSSLHEIFAVSPAGVENEWAGVRFSPGSNDGPRTTARFNNPLDVSFDGAGNLYVADSFNYTLRKITAAGTVSTLAGAAGQSGRIDGVGAAARFVRPYGVAATPAGIVYVSDGGSLRRVLPDGTVTTLVGDGGSGPVLDGLGAQAKTDPFRAAVDAAGNIFVVENNVVRLVTPAGLITTVAGTVNAVGGADGVGSAARFAGPRDITVDPDGRLYVADTNNHTIRVGQSVGPILVASPVDREAFAGETVTLRASFAGTGPFTYQWQKDGAALAEATAATLVLPDVKLTDAGAYDLVVSNATGTVTTAAAALSVSIRPAITGVATARFIIGRSGSFSPTSTGLAAPVWSISAGALPAWALLNTATGEIAGTPPNATGSPFAFTLALSDGITPFATQAFTLTVQVGHSADVSPADGALNLAELTRVIELYNTRTGTVRTGRYVLSAGTADGFAPDPAVTAGPIPTAPHSADTNRDGRLSLTELTRVIELFNTRSGTTRTGAYHILATTEDGFAPGP